METMNSAESVKENFVKEVSLELSAEGWVSFLLEAEDESYF